MVEHEVTPIDFARATEMLRQERDAFDQQKTQEHTWFILRVVMGYSAIVLLGAITIVSTLILVNNKDFPPTVVVAAGTSLVDVLGLLIGVWKIGLNTNLITKLSPVTQVRLTKGQVID